MLLTLVQKIDTRSVNDIDTSMNPEPLDKEELESTPLADRPRGTLGPCTFCQITEQEMREWQNREMAARYVMESLGLDQTFMTHEERNELLKANGYKEVPLYS